MASLKDTDKLVELIDDDIAALDKNMSREGYDVCLCTLKMAKQYINALPTIDAEPIKHGRWKTLESGNDAVCTNCEKYWIPVEDKYDFWYCPRCGARMDEDDA